MAPALSFARSVVFAAAAAGGSAAWLAVAGPVLGGHRALALCLVGLLAAYLGSIAPGHRRLVAIALAGTAGLGLLAVASGLRELALGLAVVLAVGRSGFLSRAAPARAALVETALVVGGLAFAEALGAASLAGVVLAVWGFFLVQSLYPLVPGSRRRPLEAATRDPFEVAAARAAALLDGDS